nr:hypothetical protein [Microctonus hyperodae filamentous virus]
MSGFKKCKRCNRSTCTCNKYRRVLCVDCFGDRCVCGEARAKCHKCHVYSEEMKFRDKCSQCGTMRFSSQDIGNERFMKKHVGSNSTNVGAVYKALNKRSRLPAHITLIDKNSQSALHYSRTSCVDVASRNLFLNSTECPSCTPKLPIIRCATEKVNYFDFNTQTESLEKKFGSLDIGYECSDKTKRMEAKHLYGESSKNM